MGSTESEPVPLEATTSAADSAPRVSIGLPVYNGEKYLSLALDSLLAQTFEDFELMISDNASTDGTEAICREYARRDPRVRYHRSPVNRGLAWNHNRLVHLARGEYFKWVGHDDIYHPDMLRRCVEVLDRDRDVVLCSVWEVEIDADGKVIREPAHWPQPTASSRPHERFHAILRGYGIAGGHDVYGVIRTAVLRRTPLTGTAHSNDRAMMAELALHGRFHRLPDTLHYYRDHPDRAASERRTVRSKTEILDPRRRNRLLHPMWRIYLEYALGFFLAPARVPLPWGERMRCWGHALAWLSHRLLEKARVLPPEPPFEPILRRSPVD
jgi:glycosyltransferase involved in cell wall biosynthesis